MLGMRKINHEKANIADGDGKRLANKLLTQLNYHRWDRIPTSWSDEYLKLKKLIL
jgi:hypothetical protein